MRMEFNNYRIMRIYTDNGDLCKDCGLFGQCPLIRTLCEDLAVLRYENVRIDRCKFYEKRKRA